MNDIRELPPITSLEAIADFWDTHSLADYWDQTEPAEFEFDSNARHHYLIAVDPDLLLRVQQVARRKGLHTESLINLWLQQQLQEATL